MLVYLMGLPILRKRWSRPSLRITEPDLLVLLAQHCDTLQKDIVHIILRRNSRLHVAIQEASIVPSGRHGALGLIHG